MNRKRGACIDWLDCLVLALGKFPGFGLWLCFAHESERSRGGWKNSEVDLWPSLFFFFFFYLLLFFHGSIQLSTTYSGACIVLYFSTVRPAAAAAVILLAVALSYYILYLPTCTIAALSFNFKLNFKAVFPEIQLSRFSTLSGLTMDGLGDVAV